MDYSTLTIPKKMDLLISFMDIQGFTGISKAIQDPLKLFELLNAWATLVISHIETAGGRVIKFIGDSCLIVFDEKDVDTGVSALITVKEKSEAFFKEQGFNNKMRATAHFGEVVTGEFGTGDCKNVDILGDSVNIAATLGRGDYRGMLALSPQVFRKLSNETRKRFHKYTPPIVYIADSV